MAAMNWLHVLFVTVLVAVHHRLQELINLNVSLPYLDEIFHIPQAQRYWAGKWTEWDPKITTPPGVYLWSYVYNIVRKGGRSDGNQLSVNDLRSSNASLLLVMIVALTLLTSASRRQLDSKTILQREMVISTFPLLLFFSILYYTDLFSALTVVLTLAVWEISGQTQIWQWHFQILHLLFGLLSLASRQTNIFWVGVYPAGLQLVRSIKSRLGDDKIHDPKVDDAFMEDYLLLVFSILQNAIWIIPQLILDLWPQISLLISFAAFVFWNNGVVLGDKQNHVATIHTPQLLYIWPFITFFSWPAMLPILIKLISTRSIIKQLPRLWVTILIMMLMTASVHFNTIVHPFTLADNRHYVFYVFRILTRKTWIKYAAVPVYYICAWLVITALTSSTPTSSSSAPSSSSSPQIYPMKAKPRVREEDVSNNVSISFVLIWLATTTLSLISAPLVEPRYFIIPWLIWRMNIPEPSSVSVPTSSSSSRSSTRTSNPSPSQSKNTSSEQKINFLLHQITSHHLYIELAWYILINTVTIYIFLKWTFEWKSEPGVVQRFMW